MKNSDIFMNLFSSLNKRQFKDKTSPLLNRHLPKERSYDPVNGVLFEGMNGFFLDCISSLKQYKSTAWVTGHDAYLHGKGVKKGEKPSVVCYFKQDARPASNLSMEASGSFQYYFYFNVEQCVSFPLCDETNSIVGRQRYFEVRKAHATLNTELFLDDAIDVDSEVLRKYLFKSVDPFNDLSCALALYFACQDFRVEYVPFNPAKLAKYADETPREFFKAFYFGRFHADLLLTTSEYGKSLMDEFPFTEERSIL
jgi:hypothetical protein